MANSLLINKVFFCVIVLATTLVGCGTMSGNYADVVDGTLPNAEEYVVKQGDTLYSIAFSADKDYRVVALINHLEPPFRIHAGDVLMLKSHATVKLPRPTALELAEIELLEPKIIVRPVLPKNHAKTNKSVTIAKHHMNKRPQVKKMSKVFSKHADNKKREWNLKHSKAHKTVKRNLTKTVSKKPVTHWLWPAKGKVVGTFSLERVGNRGLDISGKYGSSVRAAAPGTVVYSGSGLRGYGNLIIIKHNARYLSAYAYNKKLLVREGTHVKAGQRIATMGRANSGAVKLHFEIRRAGKPVDPRSYLS